MKKVTPEQLSKELEKEFTALHRSVSATAAKNVVDAAPVESGKLKGSINLSTNENDIIFGPEDPDGSNTKSRINRNAKEAKEKDDLFGTVGAPYARSVDQGTSDTAPTGFFTSTLSNIQAIVREAKKDIEDFRN